MATDVAAPLLNNTNVDIVNSGQTGVVDQLPSLSLDMDDNEIIGNLDQRITDSDDYWNDSKGFDLKNVRNANKRLHYGKITEKGLYRHQKEYNENQVFVAHDSILSYVTSKIAGPLVVPAGDEQRHKIFAGDLEKAIKCHSEDIVDLEAMIEVAATSIMDDRIAIIKFHFDKNYGPNGEIISEALAADEVTLDKNAKLGANPAFVCHHIKSSADELIATWPEKEKAILAELGISRRTKKQMTREIVYREVWVTEYKNKKAVEGVVWYFGKLVLEKTRNPNWLYVKEELNLLKFPKKPFIFGNLINDGKHLVDVTTPLEQAGPMQMYLNRRGRQIGENADKANGMLVIATESGLTKDDGQNITGDPNQKLFVTANGNPVEELVHQIQAQILPDYVLKDKFDARMQVGNIMGAPTDFTGTDIDEKDPTATQAIMKKNQASGRQDRLVRSITRMLRHYYQYLVQMMVVWYDDDHSFTYDTGDNEFDSVVLRRDLMQTGIRVKAAKPANPDRSRIEAIVVKLFEAKGLSLLDTYRMLQLDNPQQLYDNWAKQNADPMALARDALDTVDESSAYIAYADIMNGKKVEVKENPSQEYILSLRKLMINDDFINPTDKKRRKYQPAFIEYVNKCVDSLEARMALEEASDITPENLRPQVPTPPPTILLTTQPGVPAPMATMGGMGGGMPPTGGAMPPAAPPAGALPPGAAPGGQPGLPPMGGVPGPGMMQQQPAPTPSSVFGGVTAPGGVPVV